MRGRKDNRNVLASIFHQKEDPLVVDVERKPFEADFSDMEDSEKLSEEEQPEGRFFLKDKLCALGLADVSTY